MRELIKTREYKVYEYTQKEKDDIIKNILDKVKYKLCLYFDYNDSLSEEQIQNIINDYDNYYLVQDKIYEYNYDYIYNEINDIIQEELTQEQLTDESLKEQLTDTLLDNYDYNISDLIKNSSCNIRVELNTNYDLIDIQNYKKDITLKYFKKVFKNCYDSKKLEEEFLNCPCLYANLTFYFKLKGESILNFAKNLKENNSITLKKGISFGLFTSFNGSGSLLDVELKKDVTLNNNCWISNIKHNESEQGKNYFKCSILVDNLKKNGYSIKEVYGLFDSAYKEVTY